MTLYSLHRWGLFTECMHAAGVKETVKRDHPILADSQYQFDVKGLTFVLQCRSSSLSTLVHSQTDLLWPCACALLTRSWYILDLRKRGYESFSIRLQILPWTSLRLVGDGSARLCFVFSLVRQSIFTCQAEDKEVGDKSGFHSFCAEFIFYKTLKQPALFK